MEHKLTSLEYDLIRVNDLPDDETSWFHQKGTHTKGEEGKDKGGKGKGGKAKGNVGEELGGVKGGAEEGRIVCGGGARGTCCLRGRL